MPTVKALHVNGTSQSIDAEADRSLLSVLRDDLGLTGAKYGCGEGHCGACTVLIEGKATRSCITRMETVEDKKVRTVEGLTAGQKMHAIQEAFLAAGSMQCGYCTPGMVMSAYSLLSEKPDPTRDEIIKGMNGNICRCGTYTRIIAAIEQAAKAMKGGGK
jgi:aerobic-type carbon monoxide dehydrogenase small subunit (CoxS/CutS family)